MHGARLLRLRRLPLARTVELRALRRACFGVLRRDKRSPSIRLGAHVGASLERLFGCSS